MSETKTETTHLETVARKIDEAIRDLSKLDAVWVVMAALMNRGWFDAAAALDEARTDQSAASELRAVLQSIEWSGDIYEGEPYAPVCPCCGNFKSDGHKSDCKLSAALALAAVDRGEG